jgi:hypothetical protein
VVAIFSQGVCGFHITQEEKDSLLAELTSWLLYWRHHMFSFELQIELLSII